LQVLAYLYVAHLARATGPLPIDQAFRDFIQQSRGAPLGWIIKEWVIFGEWELLTALLLLLTLCISHEIRRAFVLFFLLALGGGGALGQLSKVLVGRLRPGDPRLGFPSGHTLAALVVVSGLLYFAYRRRLLRRPLALLGSAAGGGLIVVGVGLSRMYTDSHWLTDVLGGLLLGGAMVTGVAVALEHRVAVRGRGASLAFDRPAPTLNPGSLDPKL
jgi:membrane-associated phospholipid phosphatase